MRKTTLCVLIHAMFTLPTAVQAQQAAPEQAQAGSKKPEASPPSQSLETVTVTGIRAAVRSAVQAKEASNSMVEVVASEDIGKLPDTTIAESLARLPGMAAGIDRGNASQLVARGLGPRFIGSTLNGREFASSEPDRTVRFEIFPSESVSGATIYKTQQADIAEGGIATTVDLQTIQPLSLRERKASIKADGYYYQLGSSLQGAKKYSPRVGGIYVDQFANNTIGVAVAFSYYDQPSLEDRIDNWGFNETNSAPLPGSNGKVLKTPWGFNTSAKRGTFERDSLMGKLQYRPNSDVDITVDILRAGSRMHEPTLYHVVGNLGNWDGAISPTYSNYSTDNGYVTGATVSGQQLDNIYGDWRQKTTNTAGGVNGKFKVGDWRLEGDLARSTGTRDSRWSAVQMTMKTPGTVTWNFPRDGSMTYSFSQDSGNPANFSNTIAEQWGPTTEGHVRDALNSQQLTASRNLSWGDITKLKFGLRTTQREKQYYQTSWNFGSATIPTSALQGVTVAGQPGYVDLVGGYQSAVDQYFGSAALSSAGRAPRVSDLVNNDWRAKESSSAAFVQADLGGQLGGMSYRGNLGLRVVHTNQTGFGYEQLNGGAPTAVSDGSSYTRVLPSLNVVLNLDGEDEHQLRFGLSRGLSRAPLDVMNDAHVVTVDPKGALPTTVTGGNPHLKPMMANQVDLSYQHYFGKGGLASAGVFYKQVQDYIGIASVAGTFGGKPAFFTQQVNREGGEVHGVELLYQQALTGLPAPWNGLGFQANYTYSASNIRENGNRSGASFVPIPANGLMRSNGGLTLWYERDGFEARLAANHHTAYNRAPTWDSTKFLINGAETWLSLNLSQQIDSHLSARFGIDNMSNQKVTYTDPQNPVNQTNFRFGRRFNVGVTYKL